MPPGLEIKKPDKGKPGSEKRRQAIIERNMSLFGDPETSVDLMRRKSQQTKKLIKKKHRKIVPMPATPKGPADYNKWGKKVYSSI